MSGMFRKPRKDFPESCRVYSKWPLLVISEKQIKRLSITFFAPYPKPKSWMPPWLFWDNENWAIDVSFVNGQRRLLCGEILIIYSKDTKASSEGSGPQRDLVAKGVILLKQECVNIFPKACSKALLEEFKLLVSCQHVATKGTFYEEITLLFHKAVIILCWLHFRQHTPLLLLWRHWVDGIILCPLGDIWQCLPTFLTCMAGSTTGI